MTNIRINMIGQDDHRQRPRVLLVAYACDPSRGSEPGTGWNRVFQAARFCDTRVICEESEFASSVRRYLEAHGPIPGLEFHFLPQHRWESLMWHVPGLGYLAYNLWQRRALRLAQRLHQEHGFDLVHQVNFSTYREPGYLWKLPVPFVWGPFGGTQNFPWRFLGRLGLIEAVGEALRSVCNHLQLRFSRRVHHAARRVAVLLGSNSTVQRDFLRTVGVRPLLAPDTGIVDVTGAPRTARIGDPTLRILWVGHLISRKALNLVIEALARLAPNVPYELRVVGDGPQRRRWQRLAQRLAVEPHTTWMGRLSHAETLQQYGWADVFVFSSLRDSVGTVMPEALGAGLPVVCLDHQGASDVITEECGIKIPVTGPREVIVGLAEAITQLARHPEQREELSRGAIQRARRYLWSHLGEEMAAVYQNTSRQVVGQVSNLSPLHVPWGQAGQSGMTHLRRKLGSRLGAVLRAALGSRAGTRFGILLYHRIVTPRPGVPLLDGTVTTAVFRKQMRGLLARGYKPWPLGRAMEWHAAGRPLPPKSFVLTFDDGFECLYYEAWPVLKELGIPATIFVVTSYLDGDRPFAFDVDSADGSGHAPAAWRRSLSVAQCAELQASGLVELGSHSHSHLDFRRHPEAFLSDVQLSLGVLRDEFGLSNVGFAFPFGHHSDVLAAEARRAGLRCALTTQHELVSPGSDPFGWGRLTAEPYDTAATLAVKLDGWYSLLQDAWHRWRRRPARNGLSCP